VIDRPPTVSNKCVRTAFVSGRLRCTAEYRVAGYFSTRNARKPGVLLPNGAGKCHGIVNVSLVRIAFAELTELNRNGATGKLTGFILQWFEDVVVVVVVVVVEMSII